VRMSSACCPINEDEGSAAISDPQPPRDPPRSAAPSDGIDAKNEEALIVLCAAPVYARSIDGGSMST
jgi:hypothetical protein